MTAVSPRRNPGCQIRLFVAVAFRPIRPLRFGSSIFIKIIQEAFLNNTPWFLASFFLLIRGPLFFHLCFTSIFATFFFVFFITVRFASTERPVTKPVVVVVAFRPIRLSLFFLAKMTTFIFEQHSNVFSSFFQTPKLLVPGLCNPSHTVCSLFLLKTLNKPIFLQKAYQNQYKMHLRRLQKSSKSNQNHCIYHARYGFLRFWI